MGFKYRYLYRYLSEEDVGIFDASKMNTTEIELKARELYETINKQLKLGNLEQYSLDQLCTNELVQKILLKSLLKVIKFPYPDIYAKVYISNFKTMHSRMISRLIKDVPQRHQLLKAYFSDKTHN